MNTIIDYAKNNDLEGVIGEINADADVNLQDHLGKTALMYASDNGNKDIAEILIENGACIDLQNNDETSALMKACLRGNKDIVKLLIENGANVDLQDFNKETVLMTASENKHRDIVEMLIDAGANVDLQNVNGDTAYDLTDDNEIKFLLTPKIIQLKQMKKQAEIIKEKQHKNFFKDYYKQLNEKIIKKQANDENKLEWFVDKKYVDSFYKEINESNEYEITLFDTDENANVEYCIEWE